MQHIDAGLIHAYFDDALDAIERARVDEHIARCSECRRRINDEREIIARAAEILSAAAPPAVEAPPLPLSRRNRRPRYSMLSSPVRLAWAASVLLAVGLGWFGRTLVTTKVPVEGTVPMLRTAEPEQRDEAASVAAESAPVPLPTPAAPRSDAQRTAVTADAPAPKVADAAASAQGARVPVPVTVDPPVVGGRSDGIVYSAEAAVAPPVRSQAFAGAGWVETTPDSAERETGMQLVRLDGAEVTDVAIRKGIGIVELRTRQRLPADTTLVEIVQTREMVISLQELVLTGATASEKTQARQDSARAAEVTQAARDSARSADLARAARDSARSEQTRREAAGAQAANAPAAKPAPPAISEVTISRDGIVITARAAMPQDSLRALLERVR